MTLTFLQCYHDYDCFHLPLLCSVFLSTFEQEALPTNRCGHSAVTFGIGPDFRVVVLFGGSKGFDEGSPISETTFLLMCESPKT